MAWRSSGTTNSEMVDNLTRNGIITSEEVERGFRNVDRKFFVPKDNEDVAHADQPLKEGNVHISAPHIYGSVLEALELKPNSPLSFLNIGSGTGYLSCIVADILGPTSLNVGIEIHEDVVRHCHESVRKWRQARAHRIRSRKQQADASASENCSGNDEKQSLGRGKTSSSASTNSLRAEGLPHIEIIHGNGLNVVANSGESLVGFDRIYVGAAVEKSKLKNITKLLCPGGVLVGPVDDELVKVVRIAQAEGDSIGQRPERRPRSGVSSGSNDRSSAENEEDREDGDDDEEAAPSRSSGDREFTQQALSGVRFAPLLPQPNMRTIIPSRQWVPGMHQHFPTNFQNATIELLLCSNAEFSQPPPKPVKPENCINYAAMLPKAIWIEILSFTHRKWFEPPETDAEFLRRRLLEEQANAAKAQQARVEAEARCHVAERERDLYRLLARRWQSRLQQQQRAANAASSSSRDISNDEAGEDADTSAYSSASARRVLEVAPALDAIMSGEERAAIIGFGAMLRQFQAANNRDQSTERTEEAGNESGELFVHEQDSAMDELADEMEEEDDDDDEDAGGDGGARNLDEDDDDGDEEEDDDDDGVEDDLFDFGQAMDEEDEVREIAASVDSHTGVNELPIVGSSHVTEPREVAVGAVRSGRSEKGLLGKESPLSRVDGTTLSLTASEDL